MEEGSVRVGVRTGNLDIPHKKGSVSESDLVFSNMSEDLIDKGFVVGSLDKLVNWARTGCSAYDFWFGLRAVEMMHAYMPRYDLIALVLSKA